MDSTLIIELVKISISQSYAGYQTLDGALLNDSCSYGCEWYVQITEVCYLCKTLL